MQEAQKDRNFVKKIEQAGWVMHSEHVDLKAVSRAGSTAYCPLIFVSNSFWNDCNCIHLGLQSSIFYMKIHLREKRPGRPQLNPVDVLRYVSLFRLESFISILLIRITETEGGCKLRKISSRYRYKILLISRHVCTFIGEKGGYFNEKREKDKC